MKMLFIGVTLAVIYQIRYKRIIKVTYDKDRDTFRSELLIAISGVCALVVHERIHGAGYLHFIREVSYKPLKRKRCVVLVPAGLHGAPAVALASQTACKRVPDEGTHEPAGHRCLCNGQANSSVHCKRVPQIQFCNCRGAAAPRTSSTAQLPWCMFPSGSIRKPHAVAASNAWPLREQPC